MTKRLFVFALIFAFLCAGCGIFGQSGLYPEDNPEALEEMGIVSGNSKKATTEDVKNFLNTTAELVMRHNLIDRGHYRYVEPEYNSTVDLLIEVLSYSTMGVFDISSKPVSVSGNEEFFEEHISDEILSLLVSLENEGDSTVRKFDGETVENYLKTKFNCDDKYISLTQTESLHCDTLFENDVLYSGGYFYKNGNYYLFSIYKYTNEPYEKNYDEVKLTNISNKGTYKYVDYTIYTNTYTTEEGRPRFIYNVHAKLKDTNGELGFVEVNAKEATVKTR